MSFTSKSLANNLKDTACQLFLNTLDKIDGAKDLVLSKTILVQLDNVCGMQKLRQNAVDKVFKFESGFVTSETRNRVFVIRSSVEEVKQVAQQINSYLNQDDGPSDMKFWIIFVPKLAHYCEIVLEEEGIYEYVSLLECPLGLIPLEYDVYSLEDDTMFKTLYLNKDITPISAIVNSIFQLQALSGNIFEVYGQGSYAKMVADKLDQVNLLGGVKPSGLFDSTTTNHVEDFDNLNFKPNKTNDEDDQKSSFTEIYLIDRDCDYASLLLSQLNYEGFLDESFNISCNKLEFTANLDGEERTTIKHSLAGDLDPIFRDIRDNHFSTVFSLLKTRSQEMREKYSRSQEMNLSNLKNFVVNELKGLQAEFKSIGLHISVCEEIMKARNKYDFSDQLRTEQNIIDGVEIRKCLEYITKMIAHQLNPYVPLRLLSLLSLTQGGLPPKDYRKYHSLYCENYGLPNNVTFNNLKKIGLVTEMNLSLNALTGGMISSSSKEANRSIPSSLSLASFTGAMSSFTERASGRVAAVVSSSVLPRRGNLTQMLKKFQLVPEVGDAGYNIREPKDAAFVFNGSYIPLICQILDNCLLTPAASKAKNTQLNMTPSELMKLLPGPNFKRKQAFLGDLPVSPVHHGGQKERSILVYFIGGVTFAEITALRFLAKQRNIKIAIATTSIMNGNKLIDSLFPKQSHSLMKSVKSL